MINKSAILFEPLPIGRIGVRKKDDVVIIAKDFSTYAYMLEEYISYGAVNIVIPRSAPESATIDQIPTLLRNRIEIINDQLENESIIRLFFNLRNEFEVKIDESNCALTFKKDTDSGIIRPMEKIHSDIKKLTLGFNHGLQININKLECLKTLQFLRSITKNVSTRIVLAQLESTLNQYEDFKFDAITLPKSSKPIQLINIFDKLINDPSYLEYSSSIANLTSVERDKNVIVELRNLSRSIGSKSYISTGWDYVSKILQLWTGIPIPDSKAIISVMNNKDFPILINMEDAKKRAIENWKKSDFSNLPLSRDGSVLSNDLVEWIPISNSLDISGQDGSFLSLGKIKDVLDALVKVQAHTFNK